MKNKLINKLFFVIVCLVVLTQSAFSLGPDIPDAKLLNSLFFPRDEGSINEKKLISFIQEFAVGRGLRCTVDDINDTEYTTVSKNVIVDLGNAQSQDNIIFVCPLNSIIVRDQDFDNSLSLNIMLALIDRLAQQKSDKHFFFVFAGAIGYDSQPHYGIMSFINRFNELYPNKTLHNAIVTILDLLSTTDAVRLTNNQSGFLISEPIIKLFLDNPSPLITIDQKNRRSLFSENQTIDYSQSFSSENINVVTFTNRTNSYFESDLSPNYQTELADYFESFIHHLSDLTFPIEQNNNYILLNIFGKYHLIAENILVMILLILIFILIASRIFIPNFRRTKIIFISKVLFQFTLVLIAYYMLSFIPYLLSRLVGLVYNNANIYQTSLMIYSLTIFLFSSFTFFLVRQLFSFRLLIYHSYLYIYVAISFLFVNVLIFSIFDIMLSFIFIWAIILLILSSITARHYIVKFVFYIVSAIPLICFYIFILPAGSILSDANTYKFFNTVFFKNAIITLSTFPYLVVYLRMDHIIHTKTEFFKQKGVYTVLCIGVLVSYSILMFSIGTAMQYISSDVYIDILSDTAEGTTTLTVTGKAKTGEIFVDDGTSYYNIASTKSTSINVAPLPRPYTITTKSSINNNFENFHINITGTQKIKYINSYIVVKKGFYPFNSKIHLTKVGKADGFDIDTSANDIYHFILPRNVGDSTDIDFTMIYGTNAVMLFNVQYYTADQIKINFTNNEIKPIKTIAFIEDIKL